MSDTLAIRAGMPQDADLAARFELARRMQVFIAGNFLGALAIVLNTVLEIYMWVIIIGALLSWVNPDPYNPIVRFIWGITEPVLKPIRRLLGVRMGIDLSPLIAILIIVFLQKFLVASLADMAHRMR